MTKANKQKVIDFLSALDTNRLVTKRVEGGDYPDEESEIVREPARNVSLHYKGREVLEITEYGAFNTFDSAMVTAVDGLEHLLEETITPATLKHFEAYKKFKFKA